MCFFRQQIINFFNKNIKFAWSLCYKVNYFVKELHCLTALFRPLAKPFRYGRKITPARFLMRRNLRRRAALSADAVRPRYMADEGIRGLGS